MFRDLVFILFVSLLLGGCGGDGAIDPDERRVEQNIEPTPFLDTLTIHNDNPSLSEIQDKLRASTVKIKVSDDVFGSGFLIGDGYVVTNNHVAALSNDLKVDIQGEYRLIDAQPIAYAECADLAVIRLNLDGNYEHLDWYRRGVSSGMHIATAGFPWDVTTSDGESQYTYTEGIVNTNSNKKNTTWSSTEAFYHSAKIAGGNSGGPVIELETGKVVGINYAGTDDRQLAIDGKFAQNYILRMINGENIHSIGISPDVLISELTDSIYGVYVESVISSGKASQIGIRQGDIIYYIGNSEIQSIVNMSDDQIRKISTLEKYCSILKNYNINNGDVLPIKIIRIIDDELYECEGEINGMYLTNISDGSRCPRY